MWLKLWTKLKGYAVTIGVTIASVVTAIVSIFYARAKAKENKNLKTTVKKQNEYGRIKNEIEKETNEKLEKLNTNNSDSFNASIELLHDEANTRN